MSRLSRIREKVAKGDYDLSRHALVEMAEDRLVVADVEKAILGGTLVRTERDDPRGTKYVIEGLATDGVTRVGTAGRFAETGQYLVLTAYEVRPREE